MLAAQLNRFLAYALARSPRALELCAALDGRRLKVEVDGLPGPLWVTVCAARLQFARGATAMDATGAAADVTVSGSPCGLLALASGDASAVVARGGVSVGGDEQLAQLFQELARLLRPDLETILGHIVGRIPAHLVAQGIARLAAWGRAARESVARNAADYLAYESRDLVPRAEAESFFGGVELLRADSARLEARATELAVRIAALAPRGAA